MNESQIRADIISAELKKSIEESVRLEIDIAFLERMSPDTVVMVQINARDKDGKPTSTTDILAKKVLEEDIAKKQKSDDRIALLKALENKKK